MPFPRPSGWRIDTSSSCWPCAWTSAYLKPLTSTQPISCSAWTTTALVLDQQGSRRLFGRITDQMTSLDCQQRDCLHARLLLWVHPNEEVAITTSAHIAELENFPLLDRRHELVINKQQHQHNGCMKDDQIQLFKPHPLRPAPR